MKFSQFKDKAYIEEIHNCCEILTSKMSLVTVSTICIEIPRLNIIFRFDIDADAFLSVVNEYRSHKNFLTKVFANLYILIVWIFLKTKIARYIFFSFKMDIPLSYPAIMGGNNRFRFIDVSNTSALLVSKIFDKNYFIKNVISAYSDGFFKSLTIMPPIIVISEFVYLEKQINGIAINRIQLTDNQSSCISFEINRFFESQVKIALSHNIEEFLTTKIDTLRNYIFETNSEFSKTILDEFIEITNDVLKSLRGCVVKVAPSHGDLNRGNIFYGDDGAYIIDWGYYMYRYVNYDYIVYNLDLRHVSISKYCSTINGTSLSNSERILFLVEDLLFRILNYKSHVIDSKSHIVVIKNLIYKFLNVK